MTVSYQRFAGVCGVLAGLAGLIYLALFITYRDPAALPVALALLGVGLLASPFLVGLYLHLRVIDEGFALLGLLFGIGGAGGAAVHAAFDLSNQLHPPQAPFTYASPVDPRGFLSFAVAGLAILLFAGLISTSGLLRRSAGVLGYIAGALLVLLYAAYLILLNPNNPLVLFLIFAAGILQPAWYLWSGWQLWRGDVRSARGVAASHGRDR
jgi:hypothetical protein